MMIKSAGLERLLLIFIISSILSILLTAVHALPVGPAITVLSNTTQTSSALKVNSTINGTTPGGFIFTARVTGTQQNTRWKGYVGNVTGNLVLDDASANTLFQWSISTTTGEVYATRASGVINWSGINCTWIKEGSRRFNESNRSAEETENAALSQTNKDDNITTTFALANHSAISIGGVTIGKNECFSVQTYQKDAAQVFADSNNANFTEVILYDAAFNMSGGNVIYETTIQNDANGYIASELYDFQMILPENGAAGYSSSTAYYFYVELT